MSAFYTHCWLQGSILKGWVSCILMRILKHTENEIKIYSKTLYNLRNIQGRISKQLAWQGGPTAHIAYRLRFWASHLSTPNKLGWNSQESFLFRIFRSQNGNRNQPFRALIPDRLFTFIGYQIFIPFRQCRPDIFAFAQIQQILP